MYRYANLGKKCFYFIEMLSEKDKIINFIENLDKNKNSYHIIPQWQIKNEIYKKEIDNICSDLTELKLIFHDFDKLVEEQWSIIEKVNDNIINADNKVIISNDELKKIEDEINQILSENKNSKLLIIGHACNSEGTEEYNMQLSDDRATAVKKILTKNIKKFVHF